MKLVTVALLFVALVGCGQSGNSELNTDGKPPSLLERIVALEGRVDKHLVNKRHVSLLGRLKNSIAELKAIEIEAEIAPIPLITAIEKIESIIVAKLPAFKPDQDAALIRRIEAIEYAVTKLVGDYNQKKGGLLLRVEILKKKLAELNIELADVSALLPIVVDMEKKLDAFEATK